MINCIVRTLYVNVDGGSERHFDLGLRPGQHLALKVLVVAEAHRLHEQVKPARLRRVHHLAPRADPLHHLVGVA